MSRKRSFHEDLRIRYLRVPLELRHQALNDVDSSLFTK
jgi:hypothetical protein